MKLNLSLDLAVVISIITVFLFANGNAYLGGYLHTFNVEPISLNYSVQDKIYIGYLQGFNYLIYGILILFICMAGWHIWISFDASRKLNNYLDKKLNTTPRKYTPKIHNSTFHEELESSYSRNSTLGVLVIISLVSTLFLLAHTERKAKEKALAEIEKLSFDQVSIKSSNKKNTHFLVLCGSNVCALMDEKKKVYLEDIKNIEFSVEEKKKAP